MRILHTADWHLGRNFHGLQLTDDQRYLLLNELLPLIKEEQIQTLIIAGDIYDRAVPPVEAVELLSEVLSELSNMGVTVLAIGGNHDSGRRLQFLQNPLKRSNLFIAGELQPEAQTVKLVDEYGPIYFSLLPYADSATVRQCYQLAETLDCGEAMELMVQEARAQIPAGARSVAVAHAFIAGGAASESERPLAVGGTANVRPGIFEGYNYTALGHLHNPQRAGGENIRYSGSLMKYSFDEAQQKKGVNIIDIDGAGRVTQQFIALHPRHDVRRFTGAFADVLNGRDFAPTDDFVEVRLTDKGTIQGGFARLQERFPNLMSLQRVRTETGPQEFAASRAQEQQVSDLDLFAQYYKQQTNEELSAEERAYIAQCIEEIAHEEKEQ